MPHSVRKNDRQRLGFYGGSPFTLLSDEVKKSVAYRTLTPVARLVVIDMIGKYHLASKGDKVPIMSVGFEYVFERCTEPVSYNGFYLAITAICEHGFFETPPELQSLTVAQPAVYVPSRKWKTWHEPLAIAKLARREQKKRGRVHRDKQRRTRYHRPDDPHAPAESGTKE